MRKDKIIKTLLKRYEYCNWQLYELEMFLESIVNTTLALEDMPDEFDLFEVEDEGDTEGTKKTKGILRRVIRFTI